MKRGEQFREYRERAGLTQVEMAIALGYASGPGYAGATISQKETGGKPITRRDMLAARCLWIEANYVIN